MTIVTYLEQLDAAAQAVGIDLKVAFLEAGVPTSTFYRKKNGGGLQQKTAEKVMRAIINHGEANAPA